MFRLSSRRMAAASILWWASCAVAAPSGLEAGDGRYQHTRCVVLASLMGPADLEALAEELDVLRDLNASAVVVLIAGAQEWAHQDPPGAALLNTLRSHSNELRFEWRGDRSPAPWLVETGRPVRSALLEAAYWQDRGYRLVPFQSARVSRREAGASPGMGKGTPVREEEGKDPPSGLKFHW